jgi:hypothetical protein
MSPHVADCEGLSSIAENAGLVGCVLCCWWVAAGIAKYCIAFIFSIKQSKKNLSCLTLKDEGIVIIWNIRNY